MKLEDGIRKHGFRKWYERELMQSHAHMALAFLCAIGVFAAFEAAAQVQSVSDRVVDVFAVLICMGTGIWSIRRYLGLLSNAEAIANQADCPACETYARFEVHAAQQDGVDVRCTKCGHHWTIWE